MRYGINTRSIKQLIANSDMVIAKRAAHDSLPIVDSKSVADQSLKAISKPEPAR